MDTTRELPAGQLLYGVADIAAWIGVQHTTALDYHKVATRRRREGCTRPGDLPEPAQVVSGRPMWTSEQLHAWRAARPGRGARTDLPGPRGTAVGTAAYVAAVDGDTATVAARLGGLSAHELQSVRHAAKRLMLAAGDLLKQRLER